MPRITPSYVDVYRGIRVSADVWESNPPQCARKVPGRSSPGYRRHTNPEPVPPSCDSVTQICPALACGTG